MPPDARTGTFTAARTRSINSSSGVGASDVPARLDALGDHRVRSRRLGRLRLLNRAALVDPGAPGKPAWLAPKGHDRVGL